MALRRSRTFATEEVPGLVRDGLQFSYVQGKAATEVGVEKGKVVPKNQFIFISG